MSWFSNKNESAPGRKKPASRRLEIESLEGRVMMASNVLAVPVPVKGAQVATRADSILVNVVQIDAAKLKNLKENLGSYLDKSVLVAGNGSSINSVTGVMTAGDGKAFLNQLFGAGFGGSVQHTGSFFEQVQTTSTGHPKNPLDNQGTGLGVSRESQLEANAVTNFIRTAANDGMAAYAGYNGGVVALAVIASGSCGVGEAAAIGAGVLGFLYLDAEAWDFVFPSDDGKPDGKKEPVVQDVPQSSHTVITAAQIAGIRAFLNGAKDPVDDGIGHGGPINKEATPAAKTGAVGQWTSDMGGRVSSNLQLSAIAINARLQGNITITH